MKNQIVMALENDEKSEEELTRRFKIDIKKLTYFDPSTRKAHKEFGKFSPDHFKISKLGLLWGNLIQGRKCMSSNFTGELTYDNEE